VDQDIGAHNSEPDTQLRREWQADSTSHNATLSSHEMRGTTSEEPKAGTAKQSTRIEQSASPHIVSDPPPREEASKARQVKICALTRHTQPRGCSLMWPRAPVTDDARVPGT